MAYSYMTAISDGTLKSMPITFNYMKEDDLVVHHNVTKLTKGIDYTINNNIITFAKVIPALDRIAVDRMSQRDALRVDFTEGATFSRDNIDDVLTQLLYLTQEAVEGSVDRISPTGVLDLAGNRIINLGDPVDLQDAVPLHLVVDAEKSIYASEAKCKQYRDEALGYKNEAFTYADRAYASELNAKKSEDNAKASEINAANSASSILGAVEQSAESAAAAKVSETNAKASENKTEAMVDRVEDALVAVEGYDNRLTAAEGAISDNTDLLARYGNRSIVLGGRFTGGDDGSTVDIVVPINTNENHWVKFDLEVGSGYSNTSVLGTEVFSIFFLLKGGDTYVQHSSTSKVSSSTRIDTYSVGKPYLDEGAIKIPIHFLKKANDIFYARVQGLCIMRGSSFAEGVLVAKTSPAYGRPIVALDREVITTSNLPTPSAIGAVASSNVVGTLAEGALFEKGSNSKGTWVKFADGTIIMQVYCTARTTSQVSYIEIPCEFPIGGVTAYTVTFDLTARSGGGVMGTGGFVSNITNRTNTRCVIAYNSSGSFSSGQTKYGVATVIGRWDGFVFPPVAFYDEDGVETLDEPPLDDEFDIPQVLPYDPEI